MIERSSGIFQHRQGLIVPLRYIVLTGDDKKTYLALEFFNNSGSIINNLAVSIAIETTNGKKFLINEDVPISMVLPGEKFGDDHIIEVPTNIKKFELIQTTFDGSEEITVKNVGRKLINRLAIAFFALFLAIISVCFSFLYTTNYDATTMHSVLNADGLYLTQHDSYSVGLSKVREYSELEIFGSWHGYYVTVIKKGAVDSETELVRLSAGYIDLVESGAIDNCATLKLLDLTATTISSGAVNNCPNLVEVHLDTRKIKTNTIKNCIALTDLYLYNVESIEDYAFSNCPALRRVHIVGGRPIFSSKAIADNVLITYEQE